MMGKNDNRPKAFVHPISNAGPPVDAFQFTGRGFMPDVLSEVGFAILPEASRSVLEGGFVPGFDGMLPVAGKLGKLQPHTKPHEEGTGGSGAFLTVPAFRAMVNG